jgi:ribosomal protein S18 acetylase RimI-like enzyme
VEFTIRKMKTEDIPDVQKVAIASWKSTYEGIIPAEIQKRFLRTAYREAMMKKRLDRSFLFVAEADGKIVGFADYLPVKPDGTAELSAIYLYPEYQGKGLGTALLMEGIKNLENVKAISADVEKENKMGVAFYQDKGFQPAA